MPQTSIGLRAFCIVAAIVAASVAGISSAQAPEDVSVLQGQCSSDSGVIIDNETTGFACTNAVMSFHRNNGSVMIQFSGKSEDGRDQILGFAGPMNSRDMVSIERIYLMPGAQPLTPANRASACAFMRTGDRLMTVQCRAIAIAQGSTIETRVRFILAQ